jgi:hypothetical protein
LLLLIIIETFSQDRPQLPEDVATSNTKESHSPIVVGEETTMRGEIELVDFVTIQLDFETDQLE